MNITRVTIITIALILFLIAFAIYQSLHQTKTPLPTPQATATINGETFILEVADSPSKQQKGLSERDALPPNYGMLFTFDRPSYVSFWMKNMRFPIDIIFIHQDRIVSIAHNVPPPASQDAQLPTYQPEKPSDKVLEINAGLAKKYNFKKGDKVKINL